MKKESAAELVKRLVAENGQLTGSRLSLLLRAVDADWTPKTYDVSTLSEFIANFVPAVCAVGRSGLDPVYGLTSSHAHDSSGEDIWHVWSNPSSASALEIQPVSGDFQIATKEHPPSQDWIRLDAPDADQHRNIARDFVRLQFPAGEDSLSSLITQDGHWWHAWFKQVRKLKLTRLWTEFRRTRLLTAFEQALFKQIAVDAESPVVAKMRRLAIPGADLQQTLVQRPDTQTVRELRNIAMSAVEEMSEEELSKLRLPLGLVLRAIRRSR